MPKVETFNRNEVLGKVVQLFHEKGYNATSMQDLVDVTGLNRSSIYNSFGSKREIYQESLQLYRSQANQMIQKVLIHSKDSKAAIKRLLISSPERRSIGCFMGKCTTEMANQDQEIKSFLQNNQEHMQKLFEELIAKGQSEGEISTQQTPKALALYLFTVMQGLKVTGILLDEQKEYESLVDTTLSILD
jgi:TetR/AcrR family transcriptional repressor of nem operon